ncbi:DUF4440 domain-containing protein [Proteus alimentorum]|uniref:DUF4440 domain-containing protein n=1 Tax=Proteus alimentorum TaxID=1973495 RepID=A0ABS0IQD0_9GAMM|nr:DUF4440 domain-containing protein [Proteus alimentorum]MBG2874831.1 DUF4440 domain-containing protein [Proteus alimentorum]MBG2878219.1 DUF4440 domain-containing protein [Proteus alimentorum]
MPEFYKNLIQQEKILHKSTNRKNTDVLIQLLHDDFMEFCRSGVCVNKTDTINSFTNDNSNIMIYSENYQSSQLSDDVVLLTYISYQLKDNKKIKQTYRSSIWIKNHHGDWQLRFHQGTAKPEG